MPDPVPGKVWVPAWTLQTPSQDKLFEELVLNKIKGTTGAPKSKKRKKVDSSTKIITTEKYLEEIAAAEAEAEAELKRKEERRLLKEERKLQKKEKEQRKEQRKEKGPQKEPQKEKGPRKEPQKEKGPRKEPQTQKRKEPVEESEESEIEADDDEDEARLLALWKSLSPPTEEKDIIGKWFAVAYQHKRQTLIYIGKIVKRFLTDVDGPAAAFEVDCLKPLVGSGTILEGYAAGSEDISTFPIVNVIAGPVDVHPLRGNKWEVPDYPAIDQLFQRVKRLDRRTILAVEDFNI